MNLRASQYNFSGAARPLAGFGLHYSSNSSSAVRFLAALDYMHLLTVANFLLTESQVSHPWFSVSRRCRLGTNVHGACDNFYCLSAMQSSPLQWNVAVVGNFQLCTACGVCRAKCMGLHGVSHRIARCNTKQFAACLAVPLQVFLIYSAARLASFSLR